MSPPREPSRPTGWAEEQSRNAITSQKHDNACVGKKAAALHTRQFRHANFHRRYHESMHALFDTCVGLIRGSQRAFIHIYFTYLHYMNIYIYVCLYLDIYLYTIRYIMVAVPYVYPCNIEKSFWVRVISSGPSYRAPGAEIPKGRMRVADPPSLPIGLPFYLPI